jgi:hypothetical protein
LLLRIQLICLFLQESWLISFFDLWRINLFYLCNQNRLLEKWWRAHRRQNFIFACLTVMIEVISQSLNIWMIFLSFRWLNKATWWNICEVNFLNWCYCLMNWRFEYLSRLVIRNWRSLFQKSFDWGNCFNWSRLINFARLYVWLKVMLFWSLLYGSLRLVIYTVIWRQLILRKIFWGSRFHQCVQILTFSGNRVNTRSSRRFRSWIALFGIIRKNITLLSFFDLCFHGYLLFLKS